VTIVGYGHGGRDLHHRALRGLDDDFEVFVVDPSLTTDPPDARRLTSIADALDIGPVEDTIFHVATPPVDHVRSVTELVERGARSIIVEKPIAQNAQDAWRLQGLGRHAAIAPVSVWSHSRVTDYVRTVIASGEIGDVVSIEFEQSKPRFERSSSASSHRTAFDVELPHQVILALDLLGVVAELQAATTWSMPLDGRHVPLMGGATMRLEHAGGATSTLISDLTSPTRRRHLRVEGTRGQVLADYPLGGDATFGQVRVSGRAPRVIIRDEPLTQFFRVAYAWFDGTGPRPAADLGVHRRGVELLEEAKDRALDTVLDAASFRDEVRT